MNGEFVTGRVYGKYIEPYRPGRSEQVVTPAVDAPAPASPARFDHLDKTARRHHSGADESATGHAAHGDKIPALDVMEIVADAMK